MFVLETVILAGKSSLYADKKVRLSVQVAEVCRGISTDLLPLVVIYVAPSGSGNWS